MKDKSPYHSIKLLFCENRIEDGLMQLLNVAVYFKDSLNENDIILLMANLKEIYRRDLLRLMQTEEFLNERNRIIRGSLEINEILYKLYMIN